MCHLSVLGAKQFSFPSRVLFKVFAQNSFCFSFKQSNLPSKKNVATITKISGLNNSSSIITKNVYRPERHTEVDIGIKQSEKELDIKILMRVTCLGFFFKLPLWQLLVDWYEYYAYILYCMTFTNALCFLMNFSTL